MFQDKALQFQDLSFDPPLYSKKAKNFKVIIIDEHGNQLVGITVRLKKQGSAEVKVPDVLNYRDSTRTTLPLSGLTKDRCASAFANGSETASPNVEGCNARDRLGVLGFALCNITALWS